MLKIKGVSLQDTDDISVGITVAIICAMCQRCTQSTIALPGHSC